MPTLAQISSFLTHCSHFTPKVVLEPSYASEHLSLTMPPVISKCISYFLQHSFCTIDDLLDVMARAKWRSPKYSPQINSDISKKAIKYIIILHSLLKSLQIVTHSVTLCKLSIDCLVDFHCIESNKEYITLLSYSDTNRNENEVKFELQVAGKAYRAETGADIVECKMFFLNSGRTISIKYMKEDNIEIFAQAIEAGAQIRRYGNWCIGCSKLLSCI